MSKLASVAHGLQLRLFRRWRHVFKLVVANSFALRRKLIEEGIAPIEVVYNCAPVQPPRGPLASEPMALYVGKLIKQKGIDLLVRSFARVTEDVPEARLVICGDGPELPHLEALSRALRVSERVVFIGNLPRAELERLYTQAWVQVTPSRWREPFNMVNLEAMMRGLPVITSSEGGASEIVQAGVTGFLVQPGDETGLTKALMHVLHNAELAERLGRAARSDAARLYSDTAMVERFLQLYQGLLHA